ncbi:MAG: MFS transporter [Burkholderiales bacterium]|nr:MFS transporter [Burkholderiales bacterium]
MPIPAAREHDPYAPFRSADFRRLMAMAFLTAIVQQAQGVAIGWDIYERTGSALALGWAGLTQFLPIAAFFLPAGQIADRHDRRRVIAWSLGVWSVAALALAGAARFDAGVGWIYAAIAGTGAAIVLNRAARDAMLPKLVPPAGLQSAVAWNMSTFQVALVSGPALAGMVIAATGSAQAVYVANLVALVAAAWLALSIRHRIAPEVELVRSLAEVFAGVRHVWRTKVVLGMMSIDLFAVLLGSATALLPIYAKDILQVGPAGLGWLAAAPALGAVLMGVTQGYRRPWAHAGRAFVWGVALFGAATVVFGLSRSFWLSLAALVVLGAADNASAVIRQTVLQLRTPDALRGRVSAVNRVFISSSNELGAFESGVLAAFTGPVFAVVFGGCATLAILALGVRRFPEIRALRRVEPL